MAPHSKRLDERQRARPGAHQTRTGGQTHQAARLPLETPRPSLHEPGNRPDRVGNRTLSTASPRIYEAAGKPAHSAGRPTDRRPARPAPGLNLRTPRPTRVGRAARQAASSSAGVGGSATGSMASRGRRRSNQLGKAQVQRPNNSSTAGMRMLRMTIASRKTAVAIATPKSLSTRSSPAANDAKTTTMTPAAAVITRPVLASPSRTAALA